MAEKPKQVLVIADFRGLNTTFDPTDFQPGFAEEQVNVNGFRRGQLETRRGLREISYEDDD